jgi:predicted nicotinamide N-methyase
MSEATTPARRRHVAADGTVREFDTSSKQWVQFERQPEQNLEGPAAPLLAIEGRRFEFDFSQGEFQINGVPIYVMPAETVRDSEKQADGDTGRTVWDAAVVLAKYMEKNGAVMRGKRVLELGAGTGLAGLAAAALGARVDISDLSYCLPNIIQNIQKTNLTEGDGPPGGSDGYATARELDWMRPNFEQNRDVYDYVLGADIVWLEHLVEPLVSVMEELLFINPSALKIVIAHQTRSASTTELFFGRLSDNFDIFPLENPEGYADTKVHLFELRGKNTLDEEQNQDL